MYRKGRNGRGRDRDREIRALLIEWPQATPAGSEWTGWQWREDIVSKENKKAKKKNRTVIR